MNTRDLAIRQFAEAMGMEVGSAKEYVRRYQAEHGVPPAWLVRVEEMAAEGEAALLDAASSINDLDLADVAEDDNPAESYRELVDRRAERQLRARMAVHASWAKTDDRAARTRKAREAFELKFERQVDPNNELDPRERAIRAEHAKKAHFLRMAYKSAQARKAK